jgi:hypothetical protein
MKRLIPIIMILLSLATVMAMEPCPFGFNVQTSPPERYTGLTLVMSYKDKSWTLLEQVPGEYTTDLGAEEIPNCLYQNFDLVIKECESYAICHKTVSFSNQGYQIIDIKSANLFPETSTTSIETTIISTTESTTSTTTSTTTIVPECEECKECPDLTINYFITAIVIAIVSAGLTYGYGLKIYKKDSGEVVTMHTHPGVKGYHSINTLHSNLKIRHPKGMVIPKYEKIGTEWQYKGG